MIDLAESPEIADDDDVTGRETQKEEMREWFYERYEDPANRTPYESAEGGYIYIHGGPFEAIDVLSNQFSGEYPDDLIEELAGELNDENWEWAPIPQPEDYDEEMFSEISREGDYYSKFLLSIEQIRSILADNLESPHMDLIRKLLFANIITALETFLADAFIYHYSRSTLYLKKFVENSDKYKSEKVYLANIFKERERIETRAKKDLIKTVWHRLDIVEPYYINTFGIKFDKTLKDAVIKSIETRHDIIHRNGKDKEQQPTQVTVDMLTGLLNLVQEFAQDITPQLAALASPAQSPSPFE